MLAIDLQDPKNLILFIVVGCVLLIGVILLIILVKKNSKKNKAKKEFDNASKMIVDALGGLENIVSCDVSMSRLNVVLNDYKIVDSQQLTDAGVSGTVKTSKKLTLVVGKQFSQKLCESIKEQLEKE